MPGEASFLSRFTMKFIEVLAAGVATAVSGYVIAHLTGYSSAPPVPAPAVVAAPAAAYSGTPQQASAETSRLVPQPDTKAQESKAQESKAPESKAQDSKPQESKNVPARVADTKPVDAKAIDLKAAEAKPADAKPAATKPDPVEATVRAALAKIDASAQTKADATKPAGQAAPAAVASVPATAAPMTTASVPPATPAPPVATAATAAAQPVGQPLPILPVPPAVEIKSLPVATVDGSSPPEEAQASAEPEAQPDTPSAAPNIFTAIKHIPEMLRADKPLPDDRAPRPPMPIGQ